MKSSHNQESFEEFWAKVNDVKKKGGVDLDTTEDLSLALMNLISIEEHFFFTAMKAEKQEYFETLAIVRNMRKDLLAKLMPNHEGETWCVSKHLLSATMRFVEVGNKLYSENKKEEAMPMYQKAYRLYSIFLALKLKLVDVKKTPVNNKSGNRLESLISELADCCKE